MNNFTFYNPLSISCLVYEFLYIKIQEELLLIIENPSEFIRLYFGKKNVTKRYHSFNVVFEVISNLEKEKKRKCHKFKALYLTSRFLIRQKEILLQRSLFFRFPI